MKLKVRAFLHCQRERDIGKDRKQAVFCVSPHFLSQETSVSREERKKEDDEEDEPGRPSDCVKRGKRGLECGLPAPAVASEQLERKRESTGKRFPLLPPTLVLKCH